MAARKPPSEWQRWFAGPATPSGWRVLRFEKVDAEGKPVGKPMESLTPANAVRVFKTEDAANRAANFLNFEEGR